MIINYKYDTNIVYKQNMIGNFQYKSQSKMNP